MENNRPMSEPRSGFGDAPLTAEEMHSAMFAQMVMQLASTALVLMGRVPNPVTHKTEYDLDAARLFVDQLEMLEVKTKGNLSADEQHLLKQNLMTVRMAFVQAVQTPPAATPVADAEKPGSEKPEKPVSEVGPAPTPGGEDEAKKKFSKSYGAS
jgi:hypothetical protein